MAAKRQIEIWTRGIHSAHGPESTTNRTRAAKWIREMEQERGPDVYHSAQAVLVQKRVFWPEARGILDAGGEGRPKGAGPIEPMRSSGGRLVEVTSGAEVRPFIEWFKDDSEWEITTAAPALSELVRRRPSGGEAVPRTRPGGHA